MNNIQMPKKQQKHNLPSKIKIPGIQYTPKKVSCKFHQNSLLFYTLIVHLKLRFYQKKDTEIMQYLYFSFLSVILKFLSDQKEQRKK